MMRVEVGLYSGNKVIVRCEAFQVELNGPVKKYKFEGMPDGQHVLFDLDRIEYMRVL